MASVLVRYAKTASNRAKLLGQLDRLGRGAEGLSETDDELIAVVMDYAGDADAAAEHFDGASEIAHNDFTGKVPAPGESEDWEPILDLGGGEIIARPASSREGPPAPPETDAGGGTAPDEGGAPDTADTPSPHLSGAAQAQATADKKAAKRGKK
jgi:hypothetical protein